MLHRFVAACLMVLVASPAFAQDLRSAIRSAAAEAAAQQEEQPPRSGRIHPALLWTGIGLLGAGGLYLALGATEDSDTQTCVYGSSLGETCLSNRTVLLTSGAILAGTGGTLLGIGIAKSRRSPSITFTPGGFAVRQSVPLPFGRR